MLVKQLKLDAKVLVKFQLLTVFLADLSLATSRVSETSSLNRLSVENEFKNVDVPFAPIQFPDLRQRNNTAEEPGLVILNSNEFMEDTNKTAIDIINKRLNNERKEKPTDMAVILNNSKTKDATLISKPDNATEGDLRTFVFMKNEISKRTAIIILTVVANASIVFYLLSVFVRKILERKYGDRELLVHDDEKGQDYSNC